VCLCSHLRLRLVPAERRGAQGHVRWKDSDPRADSQDLDANTAKADRQALHVVRMAHKQLLEATDIPVKVTKTALLRQAKYDRHQSVIGRFPRTMQWIATHTETAEQFRQRKLRWAIQTICIRGDYATRRRLAELGCYGRRYGQLVEHAIAALRSNPKSSAAGRAAHAA